jgi:hypothetical protein
MAKCPLIKKVCPETNSGKEGCAWWVDVPTETGYESMCVEVAQFRLHMTGIIKTDGVHAAIVTQGESYRTTSKQMVFSLLDMREMNTALSVNDPEKLDAPTN